jgi:hypothetical protein
MRLIALVFATLLLANATLLASGPTFVQVKSATPQAASGSVAVTYTLAQTAGNLNVVVVGWNDTTSTVSTVSDSLGNNYVLAIGPTTGTGLRQSIYYAKGIKGGSNTVTVRFSPGSSVCGCPGAGVWRTGPCNSAGREGGRGGQRDEREQRCSYDHVRERLDLRGGNDHRPLHRGRNGICLSHHHQPGCRHRRRPDGQRYRKLQCDSAKQLG